MIQYAQSPKAVKDKSITFPALQSWNPVTEFVTIAAEVHGKRVLCRIDSQDLIKKYQGSKEEPMAIVSQYRGEIEQAARKMIDDKSYQDDGSILIAFNDL